MDATQQEHTKSIWMSDSVGSNYLRLDSNKSADVCIIGAGISGILAAYFLLQAGKSVIVLDDQTVGAGESSRTTAHLTFALDHGFVEINRLHGLDMARLALDSHRTAIDALENIVRSECIDCEFERVDGYLVLSPGGSLATLRQEMEAVREAGGHDVEFVQQTPLGAAAGPALRYPHQAQFHPLKFLRRLADLVIIKGGKIYGSAHMKEIKGGTPARVVTDDSYTIEANAVVVATNTPTNDRVAIHTKQAPYRTYAIAIKIPPGSVPKALYWDTNHPYHYVRMKGDDVLIAGGEDHKTGQFHDSEKLFQNLLQWVHSRVYQDAKIDFAWSGQILEPNDHLAFIGKNPLDHPNVYIATGFSGNGMTYGAIAGLLLRDLILGHSNRWSEVFDPSRIRLGGAKDFVSENLNVARQYADWATPGDVQSFEDVPRGQGAIVRQGLRKIAAYRDEKGHIHARSAKCTHLGCVVRWNSAENTWDCPCHGSRFEIDGKVLNGPAVSALPAVEIDVETHPRHESPHHRFFRL